MTKSTDTLKAAFFFLIGLLLLAGMIYTIIDTRSFLKEADVASGKVVALNAGGSHPEIAFTTSAGEHVSYAQGGLVFGMKVGDAVQVRYLAASPRTSATLDRFLAIWTVSIFLGFFGAAAVVGGFFSFPRF
ncbi:DUF3592 domain-containing protein [Burkholderia sp. Ac-20379]|uniref:DUF3592 domain-containing protein n=1 Tax=Burkholderia sp. Ac-20379 TaxID=2703900 RepID=UPI001981A32A|nr:DUF3592 domain-containing protein [Burkholderia sp. Ac-20379]MBN3723257.1 DUF3592 domain-containing protein [Burkholderia sp. Ac-20379]